MVVVGNRALTHNAGSAGVGRSGTFITLDHFIRDIDAGSIGLSEREDIIFNTVNQLREQRMYMVQSEVQYQFIYTVLRERFMRRSKSSSPAMYAHEDGDSDDDVQHSA